MTAALALAPPADASAARIAWIGVHLTPFAPGCETCAIDSPKRLHRMFQKTPAEAMRAILARLLRGPGEVGLRTDANGDLEVTGQPPAELAGGLDVEPEGHVVLAIVWDGLAESEARAALRMLIQTDWLPRAVALARADAIDNPFT